MKKSDRQPRNWLARLLTGIGRLIQGVPSFIGRALFSLVRLAKWQLDHLISVKQRLYLRRIIFQSDTPQGKRFDTVLIVLIIASVIAVMLETVSEFHEDNWWVFFVLEWVFTILFTIEYILRLYSSRQPSRYATSFFGLVDLLSILPTYISLFVMGTQHLLIVRALRLLADLPDLQNGTFR